MDVCITITIIGEAPAGCEMTKIDRQIIEDGLREVLQRVNVKNPAFDTAMKELGK